MFVFGLCFFVEFDILRIDEIQNQPTKYDDAL